MTLRLNPADKMLKAKTDLLRKHPFFGMVAFKLKIIPAPDIASTCATDGRHIFYSPEWVDLLTLGEAIGTFAHELFHCILLHMFRRCGRDSERWNYACDYAINPILVDLGFTLPEGALLDDDYRGMSAEHIYSLLPKTLPPPPRWGKILEPSAETDAQGNGHSVQELEKDWEASANAAYESAKSQGFLPGDVLEKIGFGAPLIDWGRQLQDCIGAITKTDFSWYPPDPVYIHRNLIVPTLHEPSIGHLVFAIDTSASVDLPVLKQFVSELRDLIERVKFTSITVLQCDTKIHKKTVYESEDEFNPEVVGRGGTLFRPVFDWIEDNFDEPPSALVYMTDMGASDWPETEPSYPLFWARSEKGEADYGQYIDLYLER